RGSRSVSVTAWAPGMTEFERDLLSRSDVRRASDEHHRLAGIPVMLMAERMFYEQSAEFASKKLLPHANSGAAYAAVSARILLQVLLMVVLGVIELPGRSNLRGDRAQTGSLQGIGVLGTAGFGHGALIEVEGVDARAVLSAQVIALAHAGGGIMVLPEDPQQLLQRQS